VFELRKHERVLVGLFGIWNAVAADWRHSFLVASDSNVSEIDEVLTATRQKVMCDESLHNIG